MKYVSQLIVQFNPDDTIRQGSQRIAGKRISKSGSGSPIVTIHGPPLEPLEWTTLQRAVEDLEPPARLYLRGHGDWRHQYLGDWTAAQIAWLFEDVGLGDVQTVSVTGCQCGRDADSPALLRMGLSSDSFASELHRLLKTRCDIETILHARLELVIVGPDGRKTTEPDMWLTQPLGIDISQLVGEHQRRVSPHAGHEKYSKITFYWDNEGRQRRMWSSTGNEVSILHAIPLAMKNMQRLLSGTTLRYHL